MSRGGIMRPTISSQNKINGGPGKHNHSQHPHKLSHSYFQIIISEIQFVGFSLISQIQM